MRQGGRIAIALASVALALLAGPAVAQAGGGILLSMTVSVDETPDDDTNDICGTKERITVRRGAFVDVCYSVRNLAGSNLTRHDLTDSKFGVILDDFPFVLVPNASAFINSQKKMKKKTKFEGKWVAAGSSSIETDRDEVTVKVKR